MANIISALNELDKELLKEHLPSKAQSDISRLGKLGSLPVTDLIIEEY
jgi:hypothetical protein